MFLELKVFSKKIKFKLQVILQKRNCWISDSQGSGEIDLGVSKHLKALNIFGV